MSNENVELIRKAYEAYVKGDIAELMGFVDPDPEWIYLDPRMADPEPQVCHSRNELQCALKRPAELGLRAELEEVVATATGS